MLGLFLMDWMTTMLFLIHRMCGSIHHSIQWKRLDEGGRGMSWKSRFEVQKFGILPCFEIRIVIFRISPGVSLRCKVGKHIPIKQHNKPY